MDHEAHTSLSFDELEPGMLEGAEIFDKSNKRVGTVSHMHGTGARSGIVVDVENYGGSNGKQVSIPASSIDFMRDEDGNLHGQVEWSTEDFAAMPAHTEPSQ